MKKWSRALSLAALVLFLAVPNLALADVSPEIRAAARATAQNGMEAYQKGDYARAVDYFERAEQLIHAPTHLLFIARARKEMGRLVAAREAYLKLERETLAPDAPDAFVQAKAAAAEELDALEPRIPSVSVVVQGGGDDVTVLRNGQKIPAALVGVPQPVDPGEHEFVAEGPGLISSTQTLTIGEGAKETVLLTMRPDPSADAVGSTSAPSSATPQETAQSGKGMKIAGYSLLGLGAVGAGVGAFFIIKGSSELDDSNKKFESFPGCALSTCTEDEQATIDEIDELDKSGTRKLNTGVAFAAVGGAALVTGTVLLLIAPKAGRDQSAKLRPWFGPRAVGLTGSF